MAKHRIGKQLEQKQFRQKIVPNKKRKSKEWPDYWERRGAAIYEEAEPEEGISQLIAELHPLDSSIAQKIVDTHNLALEKLCTKSEKSEQTVNSTSGRERK